MSGAFVMPGGIMADAWTEALALIMRAREQAKLEAAWRQAQHRAIVRERELAEVQRLMQ